MRCYSSEAYAVIVCLSVHPSVHLSHASIVSKQLNRESQKMPHDSPLTLVCWCWRSWRNSNGVIHLQWGHIGRLGTL